ncbi:MULTISPECIES: phosphatase PAP2 family protein [Micromonospora]|uniref:Undecaprenyl-diphosphatase n=1 Tax=Micromonospora yangpuensis TaxID=683228 RepID=A0A1C6VGH4_9ACTN|nr:phosphatase PAP2 family protein [Micromonospora yangpuensis]GGM31557.1 phosphatase PAP2 family protein [Micromonospora yangpuensis]SCL65000.1 undecaprenyl-diphosphatase [Micromonospora yangpuensis]
MSRTPVPPVEPSWRVRRLDPDHPRGLSLTLAGTAAALVAVPFTGLALLVLTGWTPLRELDRRVTDGLHAHALDHPGWTRLATLWTDVFAPNPLRVGALLVALWLLRRGNRRLAGWVAATMVFGGLLGPLLKLLVSRDRPDLSDPVSFASGYAFPSGHALNAALFAGVLLVVFLPDTRGRPGRRAALWLAASALAGLTGFSRIVLGVHWTSDVLAGWLLGAAVVTATVAAFAPWRHRGTGPAA